MRYYLFSITIIIFLFNGLQAKEIEASKPSLTLTQVDRWNLMVGKWYGKHQIKNGGYREHLVERANNGRYIITFHVYDKDGKFTEQIEVGDWGVSGSIYFTIFRGIIKNEKFLPIDTSNPYNYDAYKILNINNSEFKYKHLEFGDIFTIKKVPSTFTLNNK